MDRYGLNKYGDTVIVEGTVIGFDNGVPVIHLSGEGYLADTREHKPDDIPDSDPTPDIFDLKIDTVGQIVKVSFLYTETIPGRSFAVDAELL